MKLVPFVVVVTFLSISIHAHAQVVVEDKFNFPDLKKQENFDGPMAMAKFPDGWPAKDENIRINEVKFSKGAKTDWHRHAGAQYLIATSSGGTVQYYDPNGNVVEKTLNAGTRVRIPGGVCHRHGSNGKTESFTHIFVTLDETKWDNCDKEFKNK